MKKLTLTVAILSLTFIALQTSAMEEHEENDQPTLEKKDNEVCKSRHERWACIMKNEEPNARWISRPNGGGPISIFEETA